MIDRLRPTWVDLRNSAGLGALLATLGTATEYVQVGAGDPPMKFGDIWWVQGFIPMTAAALSASLGHRALQRSGPARWAGLAALAIVVGGLGFAVDLSTCVATAALGLAGTTSLHCSYSTVGVPWGPAEEYQFYATMAALMLGLREFTERSHRAADALHADTAQKLVLQSELAQSQLSLLTAQIEPHFLFNSLANVRRLLRTDAPAARLLLDDLLRYLAEALPRMRQERTTLGREAELVRAFLAVHQVRMAGRLRSEIDVPDELAGCTVPPMALLTLVENALKHGLQPLVEGGAIRVEARASAGVLTLSVADTGRGMGEGCGEGVGLANLNARLQAQHGAAAGLALRVNEPHGMVATITLPQAT